MHESIPTIAIQVPKRWLIGVLIALGIGGFTPQGYASDIRCQCSFAKPPWKAVGTRAACSAVTSNGRTSCNISFGGMGADPKVVFEVLGLQPKEYERQANSLLIRYLQAVDEAPQSLIAPEFIRLALPSFMRGAYLRPGVTENLKELDEAVISFTEKHAKQIAEVMEQRTHSEFKEKHATFTVMNGAVVVDFGGVRIVTIFLPAR